MRSSDKLFFSAFLLGGLLFSACQKKDGPQPQPKPSESIPVSTVVPTPEPVQTWSDPTYTWTTDYSFCRAERFCNEDPSLTEGETVETTYAVTIEPECQVAGVGVYTAEFTNPAFETQTFEVRIPALDHVYGEPTYEWSSDYRQCTAKRVCAFNPNHIDSETVDSVEEILTATTYESDGESRFTATFSNPAFETQTCTVHMNMKDDLVFTLKANGNEYSVKMKENITVNEIVVPSTYNNLPVTTIESDAFSGGTRNVRKIVFPASITSMSVFSFRDNPHLVEVDGLFRMYETLFTGCTSLKKLTLSPACREIYSRAFMGCYAEEIIIPGVVTVYGSAFNDDPYVKTISFGKNLTTVEGPFTFLRTYSLESINVDPECENYFSDNGILYERKGEELTLVEFPACNPTKNYSVLSGTTEILQEAFAYTKYVEEVTLNEEFAAFKGEEFYLSDSVKRVVITNPSISGLSNRVFTGCASLEEVIIPESADYICENGLVMNKAKTKILYVLGGYTGVITIRNTVAEIDAFNGLRCVSCSAFVVEEGNTLYCAENGILMDGAKTKIIRYPYRPTETIIDKNSIPSTVTSFERYSFAGLWHIAEMDFTGTSVAKYLFGSFANNTALRRITFSSALDELGAYLVDSCSNLTEVVFRMSKQEFLDNVTFSYSWLSDAPETLNAIFTDEIVEAHTLV